MMKQMTVDSPMQYKRYLIPAASVAVLLILLAVSLPTRNETTLDHVTATTTTSRYHRNNLSPEWLRDDFFASPFLLDKELVSLFDTMDHHHSLLSSDSLFLRKNYDGSSVFAPPSGSSSHFDIQEDDKAVTVRVSVPNVPLQNIEIEVIDGSALHIKGGTKTENGQSSSSVYFEKTFALGKHMDADNISATFKDGTLVIASPKKYSDLKQVRKIEIKTEL